MGDLLSPLQTTRNMKSKIEKFENLSFRESPRPAVEVLEVSSTRRNGDSKHSRHKKQDSTAFLQQIYLQNNSSSESLPDDAREILKSQPDHEDFLAVLRYLQYGIEGKHDFNVRASGPKAAQVLNVLVTVTIPDRWANLNARPVTPEDKEAKAMLLSCLTCVAGLGALHAQIKKLTGLAASTKTERSLMLKDAVDVLADVLCPSSFIETALRDTLHLGDKPARRTALWQELTSLLAGGKILSALAQALPLAEPAKDNKRTAQWLGDGTQYCKWLAKNVCYASSKTAPVEGEVWPMLAQILKRGLSLGYAGRRILS